MSGKWRIRKSDAGHDWLVWWQGEARITGGYFPTWVEALAYVEEWRAWKAAF